MWALYLADSALFFDLELGHKTFFGQWNNNKHDKKVCESSCMLLLLFCFSASNMDFLASLLKNEPVQENPLVHLSCGGGTAEPRDDKAC